MKKSGKDADADGAGGDKAVFDGDVDKFVEAQEAQDQEELTQLLQLHADRTMLEQASSIAEARAQLVNDAASAALTDDDARQLLNAFKADQKALGLDLLQEQKLAKAKALRRFERMKNDRKLKGSRKALKEKVEAAKAKHEEEIQLLRDDFATQALEKLESTKLEALQKVEAQQKQLQSSADRFAAEERERLSVRQEQALLALDASDHELGKTLDAEMQNELGRAQERITTTFDEFAAHAKDRKSVV